MACSIISFVVLLYVSILKIIVSYLQSQNINLDWILKQNNEVHRIYFCFSLRGTCVVEKIVLS